MHEDVYRKLRREINKMPIAYPETEGGAEIRLLQYLFTPEEAEIAAHLNIMPETLPLIHKRLNKNSISISREALENMLDGLVQKGAILGGGFFASKNKGKLYSLSQLAVGMFESQIDRMTPAYSEDFHRYFVETYHKHFYGMKTAQTRTVPISSSITPELHVAPYHDIKAYVASVEDDIAVVNCACRQYVELLGRPCRHNDIRETCLMFSDSARFVLSRGKGRRITREEALTILTRAEEAGFILQPQNTRKPQFICCCCGDCCHILNGYKLYSRPVDHFQTSYFAVMNDSLCKGCRKCVAKCGMEAISMQGKLAVINLDRCLGCGVCVAACKQKALSLQLKDKQHKPPRNQDEMYAKILIERFGIASVLKTVAKVFIGKKA